MNLNHHSRFLILINSCEYELSPKSNSVDLITISETGPKKATNFSFAWECEMPATKFLSVFLSPFGIFSVFESSKDSKNLLPKCLAVIA